MKFHRSIRTLALATLLSQPLAAEHYKLFILTGQSNSLGTTNGGEADPTSGSDPADQHVQFAWHNVANASTSLGDSSGAFTTLQDQQGGYYGGSATHWGPEIGFARTLYKAGARNFGVIKASRGGGGNTNWSKSAGGHMFNHILNTVTTTTTSLTNAGHTFEIVGLLYLQGESDNSSEASIAGTRLKELVDNLRADLPNAANMHAISGGIAASGSTRDTVRANHAAIAQSTAYIDYFSNLDLANQTAADNLHFNKTAKLTIGERFAQAYFSTGIISRNYGKLTFIGDSITQGGNGDYPSYRYQVFKNLANANVPISTTTGYKFVGSVTGPYLNSTITAPDTNGQTFENTHEGHYGWRSFWINGREALPSNRRSGNRGEGTLLNWTGQASPQQYDLNTLGNKVAYPDPSAAGTGNNGTTYTPDTAVIMIGINDLAGSSSASDVRDDIGTIVDQLQAANPNISIFLSEVLYTNQSHNHKVDALNALLPALASSKSNATSSVWVIETNDGFNPVTQTFDNVHPNADGESYVGDRISGGLGIIAMPEPAGAFSPPTSIEKDVSSFPSRFSGNAIWNGSYINGWAELNGAFASESLNGSNLLYNHSGFTTGTTLSGTNATLDGGSTTWNSSNDGDWTLEVELKLIECSNGFAIWCGTDSARIIVEIYADRTTDNGSNSFTAFHNNEDGAFHTFRIAHDSNAEVYHVWRDGQRLPPTTGAPYDVNAADSRLLFGDYTSGSFGDNFNVEIASINYDQSGDFLPPGADADNDGIPDSWEYSYFQDVVGADATADDDEDTQNNYDEYLANTDPTDHTSSFQVSTIVNSESNTWSITVPQTSPQRLYTLMHSDDLGLTDPWSPVPGQGPIIGTDAALIFTDTPSSEKAFYKVDVGLP
ncbi:sialate O-acetylesterase [Rubritalea tangerina]|uniref:Sialate O-acetylesterase n=1 Tax=Rubritalea tangerina TaxID=430798 RepID=A0ABW4ZF44_9BACT